MIVYNRYKIEYYHGGPFSNTSNHSKLLVSIHAYLMSYILNQHHGEQWIQSVKAIYYGSFVKSLHLLQI